MDKPRTIHYAGQQIIVGKSAEPVKIAPFVMPAPSPKAPRMSLLAKATIALLVVGSLLALALSSHAATVVYSPTPGVAVVPVFVSSQAATAAAVSVNLSSRTTTTNKTFYLQHLDVSAFLVTPSSFTVDSLGGVTVQSPTGTVIATMTFVNSSGSPLNRWVLDLATPIPFPSQRTISVVGAAQTTSPVTWTSNMVGFEQ